MSGGPETGGPPHLEEPRGWYSSLTPGCPQVFEEHGEVEEVFIMWGGSRSGMVCAFVRFLTQESAQKARSE